MASSKKMEATMDKITVRVTYEGQNDRLDKVILEGLSNLVWYAQGYNHETGIRDICFDYHVVPEGKLRILHPDGTHEDIVPPK